MKDFLKKYKFIFIALLVVIGVTTTMQYRAYSTNNETVTSTTFTDIANNVIEENIQMEEEFYVNYTIQPKDLEVNQIPGASKKIVLVVDTSKDMTQTTLDTVKEQLKSFVEYFSSNEEIQIGVVSYQDKGKVLQEFQPAKYINVEELVQKLIIDERNDAVIRSNIGDGLRVAYYMLYGENNSNKIDDKYVILLNSTHGNHYSSSTHNGQDYYTGWAEAETYYVFSDNKNSTYGNEYSNVIVREKLNNYNTGAVDNQIKLITMALNSEGSTANSLNKTLINTMKLNQKDNTSFSLFGVDQIANNFRVIENFILDKTKPPAPELMATVKINDKIPQKTKLNETSIKVTQNDIVSEGTSQYLNGVLELSYKYKYIFNKESNKYEAKDINVSYQAMGLSEGKAEFGNGTAYFVLASNNQSATPLKKKSINYVKQEDVFVTIQLQDSKGEIDSLYDTKTIEPIGRIYDESDIKTEFDEVYQLFGQSKAMISFEEGDTNYLKYNIINLYDDSINNIWTNMEYELSGDTLVDFPKETGIYYIVYEAGEKTNEASEEPTYEVFGRGIYGPFVIDNRFDLTRDVEYRGKDALVYKYEVSYNITPRDIKLTEIYRTEKELENQQQVEEEFLIINEFDVINPVLKETIPTGLSIGSQIVGEGLQPYEVQRVEEVMSVDLSRAGEETIKYILDSSDSDVKNWVYKAEPIVVKFEATTDINQSAIVKFSPQSGKVNYEDLTFNNSIERVEREQFFDSFTSEFQTTSKISGQGIFDNVNPNMSLSDSINVTEGMNYLMGTRLDINSDNTTFIIKLPTSATIDKNSTFIYEVNNGKIDYDSKINVFIYESGDEITVTNRNINRDTNDEGQILEDGELRCGAKYIVIYNLEFQVIGSEDNNLDSILYFGSQDDDFVNLNIESTHQLKFIKQELPHLF